MFKLNLMTPEKRLVIDQELDEITLPAAAGELNILPGHAPLMTTLGAGILSYKLKDGAKEQMAISWGYCQISSEGVSVLAENVATAAEINSRADADLLNKLEHQLMTETLDDQEWKKLHHEINRLQVQLDLVHKKH